MSGLPCHSSLFADAAAHFCSSCQRGRYSLQVSSSSPGPALLAGLISRKYRSARIERDIREQDCQATTYDVKTARTYSKTCSTFLERLVDCPSGRQQTGQLERAQFHLDYPHAFWISVRSMRTLAVDSESQRHPNVAHCLSHPLPVES